MTPYSRVDTYITTGTKIIAQPCPGRCTLKRVTITQAAAGSFGAILYSRAFTSPAKKIYAVLNCNNQCQLRFSTEFPLAIGDVVTVSGATNIAYNADHRVVRIIDYKNFVTDQTFTVSESNASGALNIPTSEQPLYKVGDAITGASGIGLASLDLDYVNQDPQTNLTNRGYPRLLYVSLDAAGTYRIGIVTTESIGVSG